MSTLNETLKYISEIEGLITYGERDLALAKYEEYNSFLTANNDGAFLWEEGNEALLNRHVAISDYVQS